jgi:hypothetical protein
VAWRDGRRFLESIACLARSYGFGHARDLTTVGPASTAPSALDSSRQVTPEAFCVVIRSELSHRSSNHAWFRGAMGLCEMYAVTDSERFGAILERMAEDPPGSALAEGAGWLLPRWRAGT